MSYILEALKKSDRKRKLGNVPDLQTDHSALASGDARRVFSPWVVWLISGIVALNCILWLWWFKPWQDQEKTVALDPSVRQEAINSSVKETGGAVPGDIVGMEEPVATVQETVLPVKIIPDEQASQKVMSTVPAGSEVVSETVASSPVASESGQPVVGETVVPGLATESLPEEKGGMALEEILIKPEENQKVSSVESQPTSSQPEVVDQGALPDHIQNALPELAISLHFFSNEPTSRLARINDHDLREGDMAGDGIRLEEITLDGVILSYRGYHFRVNKF